MSDADKPGQESTRIPDWIPGWFIRAGEVVEVGQLADEREAVRWMGGTDFPVGFLRPGESVGPAKPPQKGITIITDRVSGMGLAVPPDYWVVRDRRGALALYNPEDFKRWTRLTDLEWTPPAERPLPALTEALRKLGAEEEPELHPPGRPRKSGPFGGESDELPPCTCLDRDGQVHEQACVRGIALRSRAERQIIDADHLAEGLARGAGWMGTPPAQGTRRQLILDTLGETLETAESDGRDTTPLELADAVESALLCATIDAEGQIERQTLKPSPIHAQLDRISIPRTAAEAGKGGENRNLALWERVELVVERLSQASYVPAPEGKVPEGTKELHIVLDSRPQTLPQMIFVELEDQNGAGVGGFERRQVDDLTHVVIPYGRDDQWVQRLAMAAIVAGQDVDRPFPAEALDALLEEFGIRPTFPRDWPHRPEVVEIPEEIRREIVGLPPEATEEDTEAWGQRMLEEREQARAGESRFAEERDCAYALLRWLLPVTVAKRID